MRPGLIVAWMWTGLVVVSAIALGVSVGARDGLSVDVLTLPVIGVVYALLGLLLVARRPGNGVAWLFFVVATWVLQSGATVLVLGDGSVPPDEPSMWDVMALVWETSGYFAGLFVPVFLFFYIFPTGRFLTRRWAWAGWAGAVLTCMATLDAVLQTDIGPEPQGWTISNPIGLLETNSPILLGASGLGTLLLVVGGALAIIARYRRSEAAVRSQIKWVLFGLGVMLTSFFGSWFLPDGAPDWINSLLFMGLLTAIPASVMVAINRYHLYDIDRLVSRTIGYAIVIATLALVYVAGAVWLPAQVIGEQSSAFVAGSTLVAASLLNPVRRRVISRVDQRFNRSRYDAQKVIAEFSERLKDEIDIDQITADSTAVISRTVQPESMRVWIRGPETGRQWDSHQ